jgi:hypothetical protein
MVTAGPKGKVTAAPGSVEAAEGQQGSCRRVHRRVHHHTGGTGSETAEAAAVATRDDQWAVRRPTDCATKISNSLLTRPSRRRQRLPVQLWGQLQRPCRVLGAATDSWSLQRRYSAAMTRGGRARLAAGATEIVSTPRLVGIKGPGSVVSTPARGRLLTVQDISPPDHCDTAKHAHTHSVRSS